MDIPAKGIAKAGKSISALYTGDGPFGTSSRERPKARQHLDTDSGSIVMRTRLQRGRKGIDKKQ